MADMLIKSSRCKVSEKASKRTALRYTARVGAEETKLRGTAFQEDMSPQVGIQVKHSKRNASPLFHHSSSEVSVYGFRWATASAATIILGGAAVTSDNGSSLAVGAARAYLSSVF